MGANLEHARRQVEAAHKPVLIDVHLISLAARKYGQVEVAEAVRAWADQVEDDVDWEALEAILAAYDPPAPEPVIETSPEVVAG